MNSHTRLKPGWSAPGLPEALEAALDGAQSLTQRLHALYDRLPATECQRRGFCCSLLPGIAPAEMLGWLGEFCSSSPEARAAGAQTLVEHFLGNAARLSPCPWAQDGACGVYARRFLGCRTYGLWSRQAYENRRQAARAAAEAVREAWAGLGVSLPATVCSPGPEYCTGLSLKPGTGVSDRELEEIEDQVYAMLPAAQAPVQAAESGGDLSYFITRLVLGDEGCLKAKVAVIKSLVQGRGVQARELMAGAGDLARRWAVQLAD